MRKCKICKSNLHGRTDKLFCSVACKNYYHVNLRRVTFYEAKSIDRFLHRNRSILLEVMGKNTVQKKIEREVLEKKKFRFNYLTHFYINTKGKMMHYVYDFGWMQFSTDEILVVRKRV